MSNVLKHIFLFLIGIVVSSTIYGQGQFYNTSDSALIERTIVEAKWKYEYSLHKKSNTIIHQAGDSYNYFLYFRYDYTVEEYLNGEFKRKSWALSGNEIFYPFRNVNVFKIVQANKNNLVLEYKLANSKGAYQYHFRKVTDEEAPFVLPINQLPTVLIESSLRPAEKAKKKQKKREKKEWFAKLFGSKEKEDEIVAVDMTIEMTGGGYNGGIDPVMRDFTMIKPGGRLVKEFKTLQSDLRQTAVDINIEDYNELSAFILKKNFFDLERVYDCKTPVCMARKRKKPSPVPLRIVVRIGEQKKVVQVAIWGQDERGIRYVDYPQELEDVIQAVLKVSNSAEFSFAKR